MHCCGLLLIAVLGLTPPGNSDLVEENRRHGNYRELDTRLTTYGREKGDESRHLNRAPNIKQARLSDEIDRHRRTSDGFWERNTRATIVERGFLQGVRRVTERRATDRANIVRRDFRNNEDFRPQYSRLASDENREYRNSENIEKGSSFSRRQIHDDSRKSASGIDILSRSSHDSDRNKNRRDRIYLDAERRHVKSHSERDRFDHIQARDSTNVRARYSSDNDNVSKVREETRDIRRSLHDERLSRFDSNAKNTIRRDSKSSYRREQFDDRLLRTVRHTGCDETRHHTRRLAAASTRNIAVSRRETNDGDETRNGKTNLNIVRSDVVTRRANFAREFTDRRIELRISRPREAIPRTCLTERQNSISISESSRHTTLKPIDARYPTRFNTRNDQTDLLIEFRGPPLAFKRASRPALSEHVEARSQRLSRAIRLETTSNLNRLAGSANERDDHRSNIGLHRLTTKRSGVETRMGRSFDRDVRIRSLERRTIELEVCSSERQFSRKLTELQKDSCTESNDVRGTWHQVSMSRNIVRSVAADHSVDRDVRNLVERRSVRMNLRGLSIRSECDYARCNQEHLRSSRLSVRSRYVPPTSTRWDTRRNRVELSLTTANDQRRSFPSTERDDTRRVLVEQRLTRTDDGSRSILSTSKRDDTRRKQAELSLTRVNVQSRPNLSVERDDTRRSTVPQLYRATDERTDARTERSSLLKRNDDRFSKNRRSSSANKRDARTTEERRLTRFRVLREVQRTARSLERDIRNSQSRLTYSTELRHSMRANEFGDLQSRREQSGSLTSRSTRLDSRRNNYQLHNAERRTHEHDISQRQTVRQPSHTRLADTRLDNERQSHLIAARENKRSVARENSENIRSTERSSFSDLVRSESRKNFASTRDNNRHMIQRDGLRRSVDRHNNRYSTILLQRNTYDDKPLHSVTDREEVRRSILREDTRSGRQDDRKLGKLSRAINERSEQRQQTDRRGHQHQIARSIERIEIQSREHSDSSSIGVYARQPSASESNRRISERRMDSFETRSRKQVVRTNERSRAKESSSEPNRRINEHRMDSLEARSRRNSVHFNEYRKDRFEARSSRQVIRTIERSRTFESASESNRQISERRLDGDTRSRRQVVRTAEKPMTMENPRMIESRQNRRTKKQKTDRTTTNNVFGSLSGLSSNSKTRRLQEGIRTLMERQVINPVLDTEHYVALKDTNKKELEAEANIFNWQLLFYILHGLYLLALFLQTQTDDGSSKFNKRNWSWWNQNLHVKLD